MEGELFIPIFLFSGIAFVLWKFIDSRHKERIAILEKGMVSEDLKYLYTGSNIRNNPLSAMKYGLLAIFIGAGILVSAFASQFFQGIEEQVTAGIIFVFGGTGLITFYLIANKRISESESK